MIKRATYFATVLLCLWVSATWADGLMRPDNENYPKDLLQNRLTRIYVKLIGQIAQTQVYQEFVNEWNDTTDAVYAFPLPPDARATGLLYWYNDVCYKAVLKVREQAVTPGTGEGGVAALVNEYIGRNGIKIHLKDIPPGGIQKVQLHFVSLCAYYDGQMTYEYPLDTQQFLKYPLDLFSATIDLENNNDIQSYDLVSHQGWNVREDEPRHVVIELDASKTYLNKNLEFKYTVPNDSLNVDFYSVANDSIDGHFVLTINPDETVDSTEILSKRVVFLVDNSSSMLGFKLDQSKEAIAQCLDLLQNGDYFTIATFNRSVDYWQNQLMPATAENIQSAKEHLNSIGTGSGSDLDNALTQTLDLFPDNNFSNGILLFTDGFSVVDPKGIEDRNVYRTGVFAIGIGDDLDRAKLEMVSLLNYGFVTYFDETDNLIVGIKRVFNQINLPILKDTRFEFGLSEVHDVLPHKFPTIYQGCRFFITGRYGNPGTSAFSIAGYSADGTQAYDYFLDFSNATNQNRFAESIWAKEMIDDIERQIAVYGETDSLKNLDIHISLTYNIRCKYTAYIADYETPATEVFEITDYVPIVRSYIIGNYPNPFNMSTSIVFYLDGNAQRAGCKFIRIYNVFGQLVAVIDISHLGPGWHTIQFDGRDNWGNDLPSGIYFCQLRVGETVSTIRVSLVR